MRQTGPAPNASNLDFVEGLYAAFLRDPSALDEEWRSYFAGLSNGGPVARIGPSFKPRSLFDPSVAGSRGGGSAAAMRDSDPAALQDRLDRLVRSYRVRGHMIAKIDPS